MTTHEGPHSENDPERPLPPDSLLVLDSYLQMLSVLGQQPQFEIAEQLLAHGQQSVDELSCSLSIEGEELESYLSQLVNAGLIEKRARNDPTKSSLSIYYRPSIFAQTLFDDGIRELLDREWDLQDSYTTDE